MSTEEGMIGLEGRARRAWDDNAEWWVARMRKEPGGDPFRRSVLNDAILDAIPNRRRHVLDLACGEGYLARLLTAKAQRVTGVDWSLPLIRCAKNGATQRPKLSWVAADAQGRLPFRDGTFDYLVSNMAVMDIVNVEAAFREARRVAIVGARARYTLISPEGVAGRPDDYFVIANPEPRPVPGSDWAAWVRITPDQPNPTLYIHRPVPYYASALEATGWVLERTSRLGGGSLPEAVFLEARAS